MATTSARAGTARWRVPSSGCWASSASRVAEGTGVEADADWQHLQSPETYLGQARTANLTLSNGSVDVPRLPLNHWALGGEWSVHRGLCADGAARRVDRLPGPWLETHTWCCPRPTRSQFPSGCSSMVPRRARTTVWMSTTTARACCVMAGMYQLIRVSAEVRERLGGGHLLRARSPGLCVHLRVDLRPRKDA